MATTKSTAKRIEFRDRNWPDEIDQLREILLQCGLVEERKWGKPCYSYEGGNIAILQGFKAYFALLFFKGAIMKDPDGILEKAGENSRFARQIRFHDADDIRKVKPLLKKYILHAIEVEKSGLKVEVKEDSGPVPEELQQTFKKRPDVKTAFKALTPGRQRAYILHFSGAKQASTRQARIDKHVERILEGKGIGD